MKADEMRRIRDYVCARCGYGHSFIPGLPPESPVFALLTLRAEGEIPDFTLCEVCRDRFRVDVR